GVTLNMMILIGLVIWIDAIVSNAIVVVENILRRLGERRGQGLGEIPSTTSGIILASLIETGGGMLFATMISLLAALPIFSIQGMAGNFFRSLAVTYIREVLV